MRMRVKKWAKGELEASDIFIDDPENHIGRWKELFERPEQPLFVELGCGKGVSTCQAALNHPEINYLGIDINLSVLGVARRNAQNAFAGKRKIDNLRYTLYEIENIRRILDQNDDAERIIISFPNPWTKRHKQQKHRLTHPLRLNDYRTFLAENGEIWFKTDDDELFRASTQYFPKAGFVITEQTEDMHAGFEHENFVSEHERMFVAEGKKIKALIARKTAMDNSENCSKISFNLGIEPAQILLPNDDTDMRRWSVIACDQYTSNREYWDSVKKYTEGVPSTYHLIQPEIDLEGAEGRVSGIHAVMRRYLSDGTVNAKVENGFILCRRRIPSGDRWGLMAKVDLEKYDFAPDTRLPVRASEKTVPERIPARTHIRRGASLECPHVMLLLNDGEDSIKRLAKYAKPEKLLYDFELMQNGGSITGYALDETECLRAVSELMDRMYGEKDGFLCAVGDGNHSLAAAKSCWEELKPKLGADEKRCHPMRYALVEIVSPHSDALVFHPIHRIVFGGEMAGMISAFDGWLMQNGMRLTEGNEIGFVSEDSEKSFVIEGSGFITVSVIQNWLDEYVKAHAECRVDYIHDEKELRRLSGGKGAVGIKIGVLDKSKLFDTIKAQGVLPRKAFSMGTADEKRFYLEMRRLK
ncbi:MAG: tRNA (guanosine(46)-N7)-methyltransferase TrmB [Clostridiales bacterium]|nr:tRNA (guanosine(46)-N7)-methyltransferase TrmB [Clostridiales bacterium]